MGGGGVGWLQVDGVALQGFPTVLVYPRGAKATPADISTHTQVSNTHIHTYTHTHTHSHTVGARVAGARKCDGVLASLLTQTAIPRNY